MRRTPLRRSLRLLFALFVGPALALASTPPAAPDALPTPQAAVDELIAADRAFGAASAKTDLFAGLAPMLAEDVVMPAPPGRFVRGRQALLDALRENPDNTGARLEWAPVRGGISADGLHGFTYGFMTLHRADGTTLPLKYLAYWVKQDGGWHVAAYKRGRRSEGAVATELVPPALPPRLAPPATDAAVLAEHRAGLAAAEQAFSDEAQRIGLGPAFARWGSSDAMNMGGPDSPSFVVGAEAIAKAVDGPNPAPTSPVSWSAEEVRVASSGDLGVSIGWIRPNAKAADGSERPPIPFFTVWRRAAPGEPWRYVAE